MAYDKKQSFVAARDLIDRTIADSCFLKRVEDISNALASVFQAGKKLIICGNGGSACDAMHAAEEFTGRFKKNRRALPAIALTEPGHLTCVSNDFGFEYVFQRGVEAYGQPGDMFMGLSTSGYSENVRIALEEASKKQLVTVIFSGKSGGSMRGMADYEWIVESSETSRIQEVHMLMLHVIIESVEHQLFPELYS